MKSIFDNLVKLTDFPFAYSLIGLVLVIYGREMEWDAFEIGKFVPILTLTGLVATTLAITDPIGHAVRSIVHLMVMARGYNHGFLSINGYVNGLLSEMGHEHIINRVSTALSTQWNTFETNKIVSTAYFLILLSVMFYVINSQHFSKNIADIFSITDKTDSTDAVISTTQFIPKLDENTRSILQILDIIAMVGIGIVLVFSVRGLFKRVQLVVASFYISEYILPRVHSKFLEDKSRPELSDAETILTNDQNQLNGNLEKRDWGLAVSSATVLAVQISRLPPLERIAIDKGSLEKRSVFIP